MNGVDTRNRAIVNLPSKGSHDSHLPTAIYEYYMKRQDHAPTDRVPCSDLAGRLLEYPVCSIRHVFFIFSTVRYRLLLWNSINGFLLKHELRMIEWQGTKYLKWRGKKGDLILDHIPDIYLKEGSQTVKNHSQTNMISARPRYYIVLLIKANPCVTNNNSLTRI